MRVAVLGAGVVGTTTAFVLSRSGHEVVLIDRGAVGSGATAGNAGILTAGDSTVWAAPSTLRSIGGILAGRNPTMRTAAGLGLVPWGVRFLRECTPGRYRRNSLANHALAALSLQVLRRMTDEEHLDYGLRVGGLLVLFADRTEIEAAVAARAVLEEAGQVYEMLDRDAIFALEPALARSPHPPSWALRSAADMSGDSFAFTRRLLERAVAGGVEVRRDTEVRSFVGGRGGVTGVETSAGVVTADRYVVCLGAASPALARTAGDRLVMTPATGFSITARILDDAAIPSAAVIDHTRHVAFSRMGPRLRLSSSAVIGSASRRVADADLAPIHAAIAALFPGALELDDADPMARARPVMARNRPAIGPGSDERVYYNTGHGALGWTQACGSAVLLTALLDGTPAPLDPADFAL